MSVSRVYISNVREVTSRGGLRANIQELQPWCSMESRDLAVLFPPGKPATVEIGLDEQDTRVE